MPNNTWAQQNLALDEVIKRIDEQLSAGEMIADDSDWYTAAQSSELYHAWFLDRQPLNSPSSEALQWITRNHPSIQRITMMHYPAGNTEDDEG